MANYATLTKTGQITIPKWVREILAVTPGERIVFKRSKGSITLEREKSATEIAHNIDALIPDSARKHHLQHYAGLTSAEMQAKWATTKDAADYFMEEAKRSL